MRIARIFKALVVVALVFIFAVSFYNTGHTKGYRDALEDNAGLCETACEERNIPFAGRYEICYRKNKGALDLNALGALEGVDG